MKKDIEAAIACTRAAYSNVEAGTVVDVLKYLAEAEGYLEPLLEEDRCQASSK